MVTRVVITALFDLLYQFQILLPSGVENPLQKYSFVSIVCRSQDANGITVFVLPATFSYRTKIIFYLKYDLFKYRGKHCVSLQCSIITVGAE